MRALLLLYYFPPSGGPGVQRGVKLCRYLPEFGVEPAVVTVATETYGRPGEYTPDSTLDADVSADLRVIRTPSGDLPGLKRALLRTRTYRPAQHLLPGRFFERQAFWYGPALAACLKEVEAGRVDVLLTSSQPYVVHLVGREVARRTGVPWVADFRDPWTLSWGRSWVSERALRWEEQREEEVLTDADIVVMNTPGSATELFERRRWLSPSKVRVIPNGFDPEDLAVAPAERDPDELLIAHSGSFRARPPGAVRGGLRALLDGTAVEPVPYDLGTHSPEPLLQAIAALRDECRIRLRLVGELADGWRARIGELGLEDRVDLLGYLPHRAAVSHLLAADALYLPTITRRDGGPVSNVPAKTYEYVGSGRPLYVMAGPGDVREITTRLQRSVVLEPGDIDGLVDALRHGPPGGALAVDPPDAAPWRRREIARRMAEALREALREPLGDARGFPLGSEAVLADKSHVGPADPA